MNPEHYVNPPVYTLIMVTNFFAIAFGFIFKDILEYQVSEWNTKRQSQSQINYKTPNLIVAYLGLCISLLVFVGASLSVFCSIYWIAYGLSAIVVLPTGLLVWVQLGSMLILLVRGGSEAVDIDSYGAGQVLDVQAPKPNLSK
ncbi:MAG TPA: hypothetical protein V6D37_07290 [Candidatus Sericytochromatia bacterium]